VRLICAPKKNNTYNDQVYRNKYHNHYYMVEESCRRFDPGGSLDRRVKLSLRAPAQMGWREMEHKGGRTRLMLSCARGDALAVGVTSAREGERASPFVSPSSRATTLSYEGPGPSFYRCKERVQVYNGGVAIC
jgi:hypothetical protein